MNNFNNEVLYEEKHNCKKMNFCSLINHRGEEPNGDLLAVHTVTSLPLCSYTVALNYIFELHLV